MGILAVRRDGAKAYYRVVNPKVIEACVLLREALLEQYKNAIGFNVAAISY